MSDIGMLGEGKERMTNDAIYGKWNWGVNGKSEFFNGWEPCKRSLRRRLNGVEDRGFTKWDHSSQT